MNVILPQLERGAQGSHAGAAPAAGSGDWLRTFDHARRLAWFHAASVVSTADALPSPQPKPSRESAGPKAEAAQVGPEVDASTVTLRSSAGTLLDAAAAMASSRALTPQGACVAPGVSFNVTVPNVAAAAGATTGMQVLPARSACQAAAMPCPAAPHGIFQRAPAFPGKAIVREGSTAQCDRGSASAVMPRPPVHVHVEHRPEGVLVWLGIDARLDAASLRAAGVAAEVRRLFAATGQRVAGVVCNGRAVDVGVASNLREP